MAGRLFVVATPIGNLDDLSPRAVRVLRDVAVIAAEDTRHTGRLLQRFGITTPTSSLHEHNERGKAEVLLARVLAGEDLAVVSDAGTPAVSDPGRRLVTLAHEAGIRVETVPGPSAVTAALSASGLEADAFLFLGFPPSKGAERRAWFRRLAAGAGLVPTVVFYEAPHRITRTLQDLETAVGDVEVVLGRELTKAHEQVIRGRLSTLKDTAPPRGEYTIVFWFGRTAEKSGTAAPVDPTSIRVEFDQMTELNKVSRREAISALARRHGLTSREVFSLLEQAKNSAV